MLLYLYIVVMKKRYIFSFIAIFLSSFLSMSVLHIASVHMQSMHDGCCSQSIDVSDFVCAQHCLWQMAVLQENFVPIVPVKILLHPVIYNWVYVSSVDVKSFVAPIFHWPPVIVFVPYEDFVGITILVI